MPWRYDTSAAATPGRYDTAAATPGRYDASAAATPACPSPRLRVSLIDVRLDGRPGVGLYIVLLAVTPVSNSMP